MPKGCYVYAIARAGHPFPEDVEAVDGSAHVDVVVDHDLAAFYSPVELDDFSQDAVDARAKDLDWLGAIGYRHQSVTSALQRSGTILPLRAFTLFGSDVAVRAMLRERRPSLLASLARLDGKQEWTLRMEFEPKRWSEALAGRADSLRALAAGIADAPPGRAYLLGKKLEEERKRASREAEEQVVAEIEAAVRSALACEARTESRTDRGGAFPQINLLIERDEEARLEDLRAALETRYAGEGVTVVLTGPWPPYSFVEGEMGDG